MKTIIKKQRLKPADAGLAILFVAIVACIALLVFSETAEAAPAKTELKTQEPVATVIYQTVYVEVEPPDYQELLVKVAALQEKLTEYQTVEAERLAAEAKHQAALQEFMAEVQQESPNKFYVYNYLRSKGYSKAVACGIIGNMMCECGKNNDLQPVSPGTGNYFGLCQWSKKYHSEIIQLFADYEAKKITEEECLLGQLDYLIKTVPTTVKDSWGTLTSGKKGWKFYKAAKMTKGFTSLDFFQLTSSETAAYAFAATYERPSNTNYSKRALEALRTFEQFTFTYTEDIYFAAD